MSGRQRKYWRVSKPTKLLNAWILAAYYLAGLVGWYLLARMYYY